MSRAHPLVINVALLTLPGLIGLGCAAKEVGTTTPAPEGAGNNPVSSAPTPGDPLRVHPLASLKHVTLDAGIGGKLKLWVMDDDAKRAEGMMHLQPFEVKDGEGMIFVFPQDQEASVNRGFWMKNTHIPLDIAYLTKEGKVINVGNGVPHSEVPVTPEGKYRYVIETKRHLAGRFGIIPGKTIKIPAGLTAKE